MTGTPGNIAPLAELTGRDFRRRMPDADGARIRLRLTMLSVLFAVGFVGLSVRTIDLARTPDAARHGITEGAVSGAATLTQGRVWQKRNTIIDRRGELLAIDLPTRALMVHRRRVKNPDELAIRLAEALGEPDPAAIAARLRAGSGSIFLRRRLTPAQVHALYEVGDPALEMLPTVTRSYPTGRLSAHVVGFLDVEHHGRAGIERQFEEQLTNPTAPPVQLSLDVGVQHVVRRELQNAVEHFSAIGGTALVLDVDSGEILSLVSLPDFDANRREAARKDAFFNRATYGRYEMGSTFKTFTTAMALEVGGLSLSDGYDATDPIRAGRFTIRDFHAKKRWLSVAEIFKYSSNIGAAKMAAALGATAQRDFLDSLGLLRPSPVELPEVIRPQQPTRWKELETMTIAFGHGISVSPLQLASAMAAVVNGGRYVAPTLLKRGPDNPVSEHEIMSPENSAKLRKLLRLTVAEGTGRNAAAPGYFVGGKTGTAEKPSASGGYHENRLMTSFVGVFPIYAPRYLVLAVLDEPQGLKETFGYATASWNAAPTVGRIIPQIAPILGVRPVAVDNPDIIQTLSLPPETGKGDRKDATL